MRMLQILWALTLTVCNSGECVSQRIELYDKQSTCLAVQAEYEKMPRDRNSRWDSVTYKCRMYNALET